MLVIFPDLEAGRSQALDLSLSESETLSNYLGPGRFSLRSDLGIARNLNFCKIIFRKCANPFRLNFPACCSIKYCCKTKKRNLRLYKLCGPSYSGANAPVRVREPPAGPKKLSKSLGESIFLKFGASFGWCAQPSEQKLNAKTNFTGLLVWTIWRSSIWNNFKSRYEQNLPTASREIFEKTSWSDMFELFCLLTFSARCSLRPL